MDEKPGTRMFSWHKQIKKLHKDLNITVVYVTHDQDEAMFLSDKIVFDNVSDLTMIILAPSCEELIHKTKNRFVNFLGECNFFTLIKEKI